MVCTINTTNREQLLTGKSEKLKKITYLSQEPGFNKHIGGWITGRSKSEVVSANVRLSDSL